MRSTAQKFLRSMTACGRATLPTQVGQFQVEIQSVNRRHIEIHLNLPRLLHRFEYLIRKWVESKVARGNIHVTLTWRQEGGEEFVVTPNLPLIRALKKGWEKIADEIGLPSEMPIALLTQEKNIFLVEEDILDEALVENSLSQVVHEALDQLVLMREKEGEALVLDLRARLNVLSEAIEKISNKAHTAVEKYREKLKQRLQELFSGPLDHEEKILREVAIYAEKVDTTEEIVRFRSHLAQFEALLYKPLEEAPESRGKVLEFLVQELHREVNTIGSKASDIGVLQQVLQIKGELEKIREQMQNIE